MLSAILPAELWAFLIVFVRIGAFLALLPALGEVTVPVTVRLAIGLSLSLLLTPTVAAALPGLPASPFAMAAAVASEFAVGLFLAGMMRLLLTGLHVAGTVIGLQSGMAMAMAYDPSQGQQSVIFSNFLTMTGVVLIFASDLHLVMIRAMADGYVLFPPGNLPELGSFAELATTTVDAGFRLGIQMAAPFILYGILFNLGLGVLSRLMPAMQVFFIGLPLQILTNLLLLAVSVGAGMTWFLNQYQDTMARFLG
jgi:flagellar biosynthetic protein FliR